MSCGKEGNIFKKDPHAGEAPPLGDLRFTDPSVPSRSCCCLGRPAVKVIMPPTAGRTHPVDLWLCGHQYRASLAALLAAGASMEDLAMTTNRSQAEHAAAPL
jgi:hypothetical protein